MALYIEAESTVFHPLEVYSARLPNGLQLFVQPDDSVPVVSIQAWCHSGSIHEGEFLGAGCSHFLEHMLFKGTKNRSGAEITHTVQDLGGYINAYTSFERTVFHIDLPSAGWKTALDVLTDTVFNAALPEDEFAKEQEVIRREFAMGEDDPDRELQKLLFRTAYTTHPYQYPVIGYLELFNQLTHADLVRYYQEHYIPDNITFIVSGAVNPKEVEAELARLTENVVRKPINPEYIPAEPAQLGIREAHEKFPTDITRLFMAWHIPAITHPDLYPLDIFATVAGQGQSSRLHQELVERRNILRSVDAFSYTPAHSGLWAIHATIQPGHTVEEAQAAILSTLKDMASSVTLAELDKAKHQALASRASDLLTASGRAASIGSSWISARDVHFDVNYLKNLQEVSGEDVRRVAKKYFTQQNLTVASLSAPSEDAETTQQAKKKDDSPMELETLENGSELIMLKNSKVPLVRVRVAGRGGLLAETKETNGIGKLTARLLDKGTEKRSAEQIASEIENLGGSFSSEFGNNSFSISIEVLENDLETAIELLADIALHPVFLEEEIAKEKAKQLIDIKLEADQPMAIARNAMRQEMFGEHPYALNPLGTEASLSAISQKEIADYYEKLMAADNIIFVIAGSFKSDQAKKLFAKYFSELPKGDRFLYPDPADFPQEAKTRLIPTEKAQAIVQLGYPGINFKDPDRPALEIIDEALSDMGSRLFERIREKQSLAYFVGTGQLIGVNRGYFLFYAGTSAEKAGKVKEEILDEIQQIIREGLSEDEIRRAKAKIISQRLMENQSPATIAYHSALNQLYGLGIHAEEELLERIKAVSPQEVNAAFAKYFSSPNHISVVVQPEKSE